MVSPLLRDDAEELASTPIPDHEPSEIEQPDGKQDISSKQDQSIKPARWRYWMPVAGVRYYCYEE